MRGKIFWIAATLVTAVWALSPACSGREARGSAGMSDLVPYSVAKKMWSPELGNHRALVRVNKTSEAVRVRIPWRLRTTDADTRNIIVIDSATGERVRNLVRIEVNREFADLAFQPPTAPGVYEVYYFPHVVQMQYGGYGHAYPGPENTADPEWVKRVGLDSEELPNAKWNNLPEASVLEFQARTGFDSFYPMEIVATADEVTQFLKQNDAPYLIFPEDRSYPIRMAADLPRRWVENGPSDSFTGEAHRNEYYAFQLGLFASKQDLKEIAIAYSDLEPTAGGKAIPFTALTCFNTGGTDAYGSPLRKQISVARGKVQPLWFGVDIPRDTKPGKYKGFVVLAPKNTSARRIGIEIDVLPTVLEDRGDSEPWRHSRLRWLDSTAGIDHSVVAPYKPLRVAGRSVTCLGRTLEFGPDGLPAGLKSWGTDVLARPVRFVLEAESGEMQFNGSPARVTEAWDDAVTWESASRSGPVTLTCRATMEFDGSVQYKLTLESAEEVRAKDIRLELAMRPESAKYFMGIGHRGGFRPKDYTWKWQGPYDSFWLGSVKAGIHCELRGGSYNGPMLNLYHPAPPESWGNGGRGGCTLSEEQGMVVARAFSGERTLEPGKPVTYEFKMLITPVKQLDPGKHFAERYYHFAERPAPTPEAVEAGVNIINVHHANEVNPYINYPFVATEAMKSFVDEWQAQGMKVKIYYTVRELTNYVTEMWALRSLGTEVLADGGGGGFPWLREHLVTDYTPQWYHPYADGTADAAILTSGESRWYNYYVEGLSWLTKNIGIDGLYLDDVTYDRRILKRMRGVMERANGACVIDLHSNTGFSIGPANQYAEFFPYVDRLWFGESFNYDAMPADQWLVECSGIPFGLMGDMLQGGGNRWRGTVFGMTVRLPWISDANRADPRPVWKAWDDFGITGSKMIGYWEDNCPVTTDNPGVLATAYVKEGKTMIALASWAGSPVDVKLQLDWDAIGINSDEARIYAPEITDFQSARTFEVGEPVPVQPARGWLIVVERATVE